MSNTAFVLRWVVALLVAGVAYVAVMLAGGQVGKYLPIAPGKVLFWSAALATMLAMIAATNVAARESWIAMGGIVLLLSAIPPVAIILAALSEGFRWVGLCLLGGVVLGGFIAFAHLYRTFRVLGVSDRPH